MHKLSGRSGELVSVNIAGISAEMFSDTLFGHRKGAYTSADNNRQGLIEKAAGGSLFLDEIGDLSQASQVKLLRVLENNEYYPIGSDSPRLSTARIITATNRDLRKAVEYGTFRKDLYFRLSMNAVSLPPLRERKADLPLLTKHFLTAFYSESSKPLPPLPPGLCSLLESYDFPGNIRELKALLHNAAEVPAGSSFSIETIRDYLQNTPGWSEPKEPEEAKDDPTISFGPNLPGLKETNRLLIDEALRRSGGNQSEAAKLLGISQQALNNRLRRSQ